MAAPIGRPVTFRLDFNTDAIRAEMRERITVAVEQAAEQVEHRAIERAPVRKYSRRHTRRKYNVFGPSRVGLYGGIALGTKGGRFTVKDVMSGFSRLSGLKTGAPRPFITSNARIQRLASHTGGPIGTFEGTIKGAGGSRATRTSPGLGKGGVVTGEGAGLHINRVKNPETNKALSYRARSEIRRGIGFSNPGGKSGADPTYGGTLRKSIAARDAVIAGESRTVTVESAAPYSRYVEFPTHRTAAQPFLLPALKLIRLKYRTFFVRQFRGS
jgi:hypothetical protein